MYLWRLFRELDCRRTSNGFGPNPLSFVEIDAWMRATRRTLKAWEVEALTSIDNAIQKAFSEERSKSKQTEKPKKRGRR